VKLQLFDEDALPIETVHAMLEFSNLSEDNTIGTFQPATSSGNANDDNIFWYDNTTNQYIYNLDTSDCVSGVYLLRITLNFCGFCSRMICLASYLQLPHSE
jgi:hypothetical protein